MGAIELWGAVLLQAAQDERKRNTGYFSLDNKDFIMLCDLANECPYRAIEKAARVKHNLTLD